MAKFYHLEEIYDELSQEKNVTLFVAPPVRFGYKQSDYLYLFYKDLFKSGRYSIENITIAGHFKPIILNLRSKPSIFHYHWIECTGIINLPFFIYKFLCLFIYTKTGGNLVWTIHNKMPLDGKYLWINKIVRVWVARNADLLHTQCASAIQELSHFYGVDESKFRTIPHPKYPPMLMPRAAAIEAINYRFDVNIKVQDRLFLMIGHISEYKQIEQVCEIFKEEPVQKKLIVAGPVKKGHMKVFKRIRKLVSPLPNVILIPQFIKEESVPEFMNAADILVFNFKDVFTSGGVYLALSYNKPIFMPRTDCMMELEGENNHFFENLHELKELIIQS